MFKQLSYNTIFRIVGFGIGFFLSVVIARKLGSDDYGVFAIFLTIGGFISGLGMFGFPEYVVKNISVTKTFNNKILFVLLNSTLIVLILILLFNVFESQVYALFNVTRQQLTNTLYFFGYIIFVSSNFLLQRVLEGFHFSQGGYFIKEVLGRLFKLIPLLFIPISLENVFIVFFLSELMVFILFFTIILIKYGVDIDRKKILPSKNDIKKIYQYTFPLFATTLVLIFNGQTIKLLLASFEEAKYVGFYNISLNFSALMIIGLNIQNTILKPYFSKFFHDNNLQAIQQYYFKSSKLLTLISLPVGLLFLGMPKLFLTFYGKEYYDAAIILQLIIISTIINISTGSNYPILVMSKISHKEFTANILNFISVISLGTLFIYLFGYIGAGLILIISQTIVNVYRIIVLNRAFGLKPFKNMFQVYFLLISAMMVIFSLSNIFQDSVMYLLPLVIIVIGVTCWLFIKIAFVPGEIKEYYSLLKEKIIVK